ncbi:MAG TPA: DUF3263 domain-containing protein [Acidimicrobiia bacterium]|jgi:hypothetical protein
MLSDRDRRVLDFEGSWWLYPGPKDRAIRDYLGMTATRYYQVLRRLAEDDRALDHAPLTIRRIRKMRRQRIDEVSARFDGSGDSTG